MTDLVVQSALEPYAQPPRLPDGWHVRSWSVTIERRDRWMNADKVEVACVLLHEEGVEVALNIEFAAGSPPALDWLRSFLDGARVVPDGVYARAQRMVL